MWTALFVPKCSQREQNFFHNLCSQCEHLFRNHNPCSQCEQDFRNANNLCSQHEQSYTGSHATHDWLHAMISWHIKGICFLFKSPKILHLHSFLLLLRLHPNSFFLFIPDWFDDVPLVAVVLLDDNSGIHCTGKKLLSWTFISSVHSSSLSPLNVLLNLAIDGKLV